MLHTLAQSKLRVLHGVSVLCLCWQRQQAVSLDSLLKNRGCRQTLSIATQGSDSNPGGAQKRVRGLLRSLLRLWETSPHPQCPDGQFWGGGLVPHADPLSHRLGSAAGGSWPLHTHSVSKRDVLSSSMSSVCRVTRVAPRSLQGVRETHYI